MPVAKRRRSHEAWQYAWENRNLVHWLMNRMERTPNDEDWAFSIGLDALCASFETYRPGGNTTLKRYSIICVKNALYESVYSDKTINVAVYVRKIAEKCISGKIDFADVPDTSPGRTGLRAMVKDAIKVLPRGDEYYAANEPYYCPAPHVPCDLLRQALDQLYPVERKAIDYLYPLSEDAPAVELTTKQRWEVKMIERRALKRMRNFLESKGYESN